MHLHGTYQAVLVLPQHSQVSASLGHQGGWFRRGGRGGLEESSSITYSYPTILILDGSGRVDGGEGHSGEGRGGRVTWNNCACRLFDSEVNTVSIVYIFCQL